MIFPFVYDCAKSIDIYHETLDHLEQTGFAERIATLGWAYHSIGDVIPHTAENYWSGHFFPWAESWDEIQVSFNLCLFGFYKQAMVSLRAGLELGLLSVYWNLNDDGHKTVQAWMRSQEDTPFHPIIWKKLENHRNFQEFQQKYDMKSRLSKVRSLLNDYAHTKGYRFSNSLGIPKPNFQTFEPSGFEKWFQAYQEVIVVLSILHLVKYPIGTVTRDYFSKFGIDVPSFGGIDPGKVARLEQVIGEETFGYLQEITHYDPAVQDLLTWIDGLPNMSREQIDQQVVELEKIMIQQQGFAKWAESNQHFLSDEHYRGLYTTLKAWAEENGLEKPADERGPISSN